LNDSTGVVGFGSLAQEIEKAAIEKDRIKNRERMIRNFAIRPGGALKQKVYPNERSARNKWNAKK